MIWFLYLIFTLGIIQYELFSTKTTTLSDSYLNSVEFYLQNRKTSPPTAPSVKQYSTLNHFCCCIMLRKCTCNHFSNQKLNIFPFFSKTLIMSAVTVTLTFNHKRLLLLVPYCILSSVVSMRSRCYAPPAF